jgi:hypothetical protein
MGRLRKTNLIGFIPQFFEKFATPQALFAPAFRQVFAAHKNAFFVN